MIERMGALEFWLLIFAGLLISSGIVAAMLPSRPEWIGFVAVPVIASVSVTVYVFTIDQDAQAPVFLFIFYFVAGVAGALGSLAGRALYRRHG